MARKKCNLYSGIGGQAVLEGVMMKNQEKYAVAVRKPNGEIAIDVENHQGVLHGNKIKKIPFVRGVFNFIDSLVLGMKSINYSASFYDEEDEPGKDAKKSGGKGEKVMNTLVTLVSVVIAIGIFVVLPYYLAAWLGSPIRNESLKAILEGVIRILVFILYVWAISLMKDIRRLYRYHGAEHKCINCIERGKPLTVRNAMRSSRLHKRCGTSFIFFVLFISIILFFFIRVSNPLLKVLLRILLMPVVAGISYEIIRLAGRSNNIIVRIISAPGMLIQRMTTKEPDKEMIEVAIAAVEAVFDWKKYLADNFGYQEGAEESGEYAEQYADEPEYEEDRYEEDEAAYYEEESGEYAEDTYYENQDDEIGYAETGDGEYTEEAEYCEDGGYAEQEYTEDTYYEGQDDATGYEEPEDDASDEEIVESAEVKSSKKKKGSKRR